MNTESTVDRASLPVAEPIKFSELAQFKVVRVNPLPAWENLHTAEYATGVYDYWMEVIAKSPDYDPAQEQFATIFLTGQRKIMGHALIAKGTFTSVVASPPEAFRAAIIAGAPEIVVAHNHPGDSPKPSTADCTVYIRMAIVARIVGVKLLDSMVIGEKCSEYPLGFARISEDKRVSGMVDEFIKNAEKMGLLPKDGLKGDQDNAIQVWPWFDQDARDGNYGTVDFNAPMYLERGLSQECQNAVDESISPEFQALIDAMHHEDLRAQFESEDLRAQSEANRKERFERPTAEYDPECEVSEHRDAQGNLIAAHCGNEFGAVGDWQWENEKRRTCPKCKRRLPLTERQRRAWKRHAIKAAIRIALIAGLLALAFGLHSSWREGLAFGLMDLATGPITDNLWEVV